MSTLAQLINGSNTITFASPGYVAWYRIEQGWAPRVAGLRASPFGGRGPYDDVQEEIPISVGGSSAAHLYSNISELKLILEHANNWYNGSFHTPTLFWYSPEGASTSDTATPLFAQIWNANVELPQNWANIPPAGQRWTTGATLRLTRMGIWSGETSFSRQASGGSNGSPALFVMASAASVWTPVTPIVTCYPYSGSAMMSPGFVGIASGSTITPAGASVAAIQRFNAGSSGTPLGSASGFSNVSASATNAIGGSVLRYTPAGSAAASGGNRTSGASFSWSTTYSVYLSVKNNSPSTSYIVKLKGYPSGNSTPGVYIPASFAGSIGYAGYVFAGNFATNYPDTALDFEITASGSSASGIDFDNVVIIDNALGSVVKFSGNIAASANSDVYFEDNVSNGRYFSVNDAVTETYFSHAGTGFAVSGASGQYILMATTRNSFRHLNLGGSIQANTATINWYNAFLTPV